MMAVGVRYSSTQVRIGHAVGSRIAAEVLHWHDEVVRNLTGATEIIRTGADQTAVVDYDVLDKNPERVVDIIQSGLGSASLHDDVILYDLSENAYDLLREPLLLHLAATIDASRENGSKALHVIALPRLPGPEAASMVRLKTTVDSRPSARTVVLGRDDGFYSFGAVSVDTEFTQARASLQALRSSPALRVEESKIRRLGHFRRDDGSCRYFSYSLDSVSGELRELLLDWWETNAVNAEGIIYHSASNPSLITAVKAVAGSLGVSSASSEDLFSDRPMRFLKMGSYSIVVDAVESGHTLQRIAGRLKALRRTVRPYAFAAIGKGWASETTFDGIHVHIALTVPLEITPSPCEQCELGLGFDSDSGETYLELRAFDLWHMARDVGWEPEPDQPTGPESAYAYVPSFPLMLERYGDWLSYKMLRRLSEMPHPESYFVLYPDEPSAVALVDKLRIRFRDGLASVKVPRAAIKRAQAYGNDWKAMLEKLDRNEEWLEQLRSLSAGPGRPRVDPPAALILDIFNGSGRTYASLHKLLKCFGIEPFCYFPMIDRDPLGECGQPYEVKKLSLYQWYGPRCILDGTRRR